jgi:hypothetical protein
MFARLPSAGVTEYALMAAERKTMDNSSTSCYYINNKSEKCNNGCGEGNGGYSPKTLPCYFNKNGKCDFRPGLGQSFSNQF